MVIAFSSTQGGFRFPLEIVKEIGHVRFAELFDRFLVGSLKLWQLLPAPEGCPVDAESLRRLFQARRSQQGGDCLLDHQVAQLVTVATGHGFILLSES
jgi:hypothetical protein